MLQDAHAAEAARKAYHAAAERHAERALEMQDRGRREEARYLARLALLCQRAEKLETT